MEEIWKPVVGYEGFYEVSNIGRVRSLARIVECSDGRKRKIKDRTLKGSSYSGGYSGVTLHKDGCAKSVNIHRIVAEAFVPNPLEKEEVNHKDENPSNNHASNLEWVTHKENINYGTRTERARETTTKLQGKAVQQFSKDGKLVAEYESISIAYRATGAFISNIVKCARGEYKTAGGYIWKYKDETMEEK